MGVFLTDRTGTVLGLSNRLWQLTGQSLTALEAPHVGLAWTRDGYVPSWLGRSWGGVLFDRLGELVVVARPVPGRVDLRPVAVYRSGSPSALQWARAGEQLSVYDLPFAPVLLHVAQFLSAGTGHTTTTLRPPAPGSAVSPVAARVWQVRSGLYPPPSTTRSSRTAPPPPRTPARGPRR